MNDYKKNQPQRNPQENDNGLNDSYMIVISIISIYLLILAS